MIRDRRHLIRGHQLDHAEYDCLFEVMPDTGPITPHPERSLNSLRACSSSNALKNPCFASFLGLIMAECLSRLGRIRT